jgi:hypothetical protein
MLKQRLIIHIQELLTWDILLPIHLDFKFVTSQYMQLNASGFLGLSDPASWGAFVPLSLVHLNDATTPSINLHTRFTNSASSSTSGGLLVGLNASGNGKMLDNFDIDLFTSGLLRMTVFSGGKVRVNTTSLTSAALFEVSNDINLTSSIKNNGYRIQDSIVLQKPHVGNLFVGAGAGINLTSGDNNVLVGTDAGRSINDGTGNVLVGYGAGYNVKTAASYENTFVGLQAGYNTGISGTGGYHNSFFGDNAGLHNTTGLENTFIGAHSGQTNTTGNYIVCLGSLAGIVNTASNNTFIGFQSGGYSSTGINNAFLGYQSGFDNVAGKDITSIGAFSGNNSLLDSNTFLGTRTGVVTGLEFSATAIGANAIVPQHHQMILGDNNICRSRSFRR